MSIAVTNNTEYGIPVDEFTYCAEFDGQPIAITVSNTMAVRGKYQPGLQAAAMLSEVEPEIEYLESLFGYELDFDWVQSVPDISGYKLISDAERTPEIKIQISRVALHSANTKSGLPIPDRLRWQSSDYKILLTRINLEQEESKSLELGAAVLLPESFQEYCLATAESIDSTEKMQVLIEDDQVSFKSHETQPANNEFNGLEVSLDSKILLPPEFFINKAPIRLDRTLQGAPCVINLRPSNQRIKGELTKVGCGYAAVVKSMEIVNGL